MNARQIISALVEDVEEDFVLDFLRVILVATLEIVKLGSTAKVTDSLHQFISVKQR